MADVVPQIVEAIPPPHLVQLLSSHKRPVTSQVVSEANSYNSFNRNTFVSMNPIFNQFVIDSRFMFVAA